MVLFLVFLVFKMLVRFQILVFAFEKYFPKLKRSCGLDFVEAFSF